jgi:hypothetical protein
MGPWTLRLLLQKTVLDKHLYILHTPGGTEEEHKQSQGSQFGSRPGFIPDNSNLLPLYKLFE